MGISYSDYQLACYVFLVHFPRWNFQSWRALRTAEPAILVPVINVSKQTMKPDPGV